MVVYVHVECGRYDIAKECEKRTEKRMQRVYIHIFVARGAAMVRKSNGSREREWDGKV